MLKTKIEELSDLVNVDDVKELLHPEIFIHYYSHEEISLIEDTLDTMDETYETLVSMNPSKEELEKFTNERNKIIEEYESSVDVSRMSRIVENGEYFFVIPVTGYVSVKIIDKIDTELIPNNDVEEDVKYLTEIRSKHQEILDLVNEITNLSVLKNLSEEEFEEIQGLNLQSVKQKGLMKLREMNLPVITKKVAIEKALRGENFKGKFTRDQRIFLQKAFYHIILTREEEEVIDFTRDFLDRLNFTSSYDSEKVSESVANLSKQFEDSLDKVLAIYEI